MNTIFAGFITTGGNNATVAGASNNNRFTLQRRIIDNLNGYEERIQVKMDDMTDLFRHFSKLLNKVQGERHKEQESRGDPPKKVKKINRGYTLYLVLFLCLVPFLLYLNDGMGMVKSRNRSVKGPG